MNHSKNRYYKDLVRKDQYRLFQIPRDSIDYIIDIGANVGFFSQLCLCMQRKAQIFAIEPCVETFEKLCDNLSDLPPVKCYNIAMGCGQDLYFQGQIMESILVV